MRIRRRILLAVAAVLLLSAPAAAAPQLVSFGDGGVRLGETKLFDKAVDGAAHDAAQELIWFSSAGTLYVIDLRDAARTPVAIAPPCCWFWKHVKSGRSRHANGPHKRTPALIAASCTTLMSRS